jgi:hypothetical protein
MAKKKTTMMITEKMNTSRMMTNNSRKRMKLAYLKNKVVSSLTRNRNKDKNKIRRISQIKMSLTKT